AQACPVSLGIATSWWLCPSANLVSAWPHAYPRKSTAEQSRRWTRGSILVSGQLQQPPALPPIAGSLASCYTRANTTSQRYPSGKRPRPQRGRLLFIGPPGRLDGPGHDRIDPQQAQSLGDVGPELLELIRVDRERDRAK